MVELADKLVDEPWQKILAPEKVTLIVSKGATIISEELEQIPLDAVTV